MNLILCGMPGVGKTYVGSKLAQQLVWDFVDIDHLIEEKAGQTCREIVLMQGEDVFRKLEKEAVLSLNCTQAVIATGGGILKDPDNVELLRRCGKLVYLKDNLGCLYKRLLAKKELPSYIDVDRPEESFKEMFLQRKPFYEQCDVTLDLSGMVEEEIIAKLKLFF